MPVAPALWVDEFTRQHLAFRVERRMGAADVIEMLDLAGACLIVCVSVFCLKGLMHDE